MSARPTPARAPSPSHPLRELQRTLGNQGVGRLLGGEHGAGHPVQRFPASVLSVPFKWTGTVGRVSRPGEGVSGGVYFLSSRRQDDVKRVVVKPVFGVTGKGTETAEQLQFGDLAMKEFLGVSTPASRIVPSGSAEFGELVGMMRVYQPKKPAQEQMGAAPWKDLSEAQSLIVMGEVPNARSLSGMVEKAATDTKAHGDLMDVVFSHRFMEQLARICAGDLLLGNRDRVGFGMMNLGNVMVSKSKDGADLWAIDTTAAINTTTTVKNFAEEASGGGFDTVKSEIALLESGENLEGLVHIIIDNLGGAAAGPGMLFKQRWDSEGPALKKAFAMYLGSTFLDIHALVTSKPGRAKMKGLTGQYAGTAGGRDLNYGALKATAQYLGGRGTGGTHAEAIEKPELTYAVAKLQAVGPDAFGFPLAGFRPGDVVRLPSSAKTADGGVALAVSSKASLAKNAGAGWNQTYFADQSSIVKKVKEDVQATETKKRGVIFKEELTRNSVHAGLSATTATMVGLGATRFKGIYADAGPVVDAAVRVVELGASPAQARRVLLGTGFAKSAMMTAKVQLDAYPSSLTNAVNDLRTLKKFKDAGKLADHIEAIAAGVLEDKRYEKLMPKLDSALTALRTTAGTRT